MRRDHPKVVLAVPVTGAHDLLREVILLYILKEYMGLPNRAERFAYIYYVKSIDVRSEGMMKLPHLTTALRKVAAAVALFWAVILLFVIIQSALNVPVAGVKPEAARLRLMMTLPFTVGVSVAIIVITYFLQRRRGTT